MYTHLFLIKISITAVAAVPSLYRVRAVKKEKKKKECHIVIPHHERIIRNSMCGQGNEIQLRQNGFFSPLARHGQIQRIWLKCGG